MIRLTIRRGTQNIVCISQVYRFIPAIIKVHQKTRRLKRQITLVNESEERMLFITCRFQFYRIHVMRNFFSNLAGR